MAGWLSGHDWPMTPQVKWASLLSRRSIIVVPRLVIDPQTATFETLAPAARVLMDGGLIACPTDSFYALTTLADNHCGLDLLMKLKGEARGGKPILLLIDQLARVKCYAREVPEEARGLMDCFWPGPLTLLFLAHRGLHSSLIGSSGRTVGLRVEGQPYIRRLVRMVDRGLSGTSANPSGAPPATTAQAVEDYFGHEVALIIDGGPTAGGRPSTLIDASLGTLRILREGPLSLNELIEACPGLRFKP